MTDDDKQYEYVPQIAPGVLDARLQAKDLELQDLKGDLRQVERERDEARLALREVKAERSEAQHDATERLIERNEAQRKAYNLQILHDDAMAMLSAMTAERNAARQLARAWKASARYWWNRYTELYRGVDKASPPSAIPELERAWMALATWNEERERTLSQAMEDDGR